MKKFLSRAALGVAAAGVFALASCNGTTDPTTTEEKPTTTPVPTTTADDSINEAARKLLANLIFEADGTAVTGNIALPAYLASGETQVTINWESDSELVKVGTTVDEAKGVFTGTVSRPEDETVRVTLTASITFAGGEASRQFTVLVNPYTVSDAIDAFTFDYNGGTVEKDFEVPTSFKFNNQDVTIAWSIPDSAKELLSVDEDGKTIHVVQQEKREKAQIKAEFTYKGETLSRNYRLNVFHVRTPLELLHTFYDEPGAEAYKLKGYVAHKAGYDAKYGNGYLYLVDQTLEGGYYVYRAYCDQKTWDSLAIGTAVEIPACKSTDYNGLIEVGQNKENIVKVSTELPELTADQLKLVTKGLAADQLFVKYSQGDKELMYHTGQRVNLTSWKVVEIDATTTATSEGVLATLEKAGVQVKVQLSKYATTLDGDIAKAAVKKVKELKVGDFVNVTGILSNNNGYCIYVSDETTFTNTEDDANASLGELKDLVDPVFAALAEFPDTITEVFNLDKTTITTVDGVELTIEASSLGAWEGNVLTITPETTEKTIKVTVTAAKDGISFAKEIEIYTKQMTAADKVAAEMEALKVPAEEFGVYELPLVGARFDSVTISWVLTEGNGIATLAEDGKTLTILSVDENTEVKLTATITEGEETDTKEITLTISNQSRTEIKVVTAPVADTTYYLGFYQGKLGAYYYATGVLSGTKYIATTDDYAKAMTVTAVVNDGTYAFKFSNGKYIALDGTNVALSDDAFYWTYDDETGAWKSAVYSEETVTEDTFADLKSTLYTYDNSTYTLLDDSATYDSTAKYYTMVYWYFGTYSNYTTVAASKISYAKTSYVGHLYEITDLTKTKEEKIAYEMENVSPELTQDSTTDYTLPEATLFEDVVITYAVDSSDTTGTTIDEGVITFGEVTSSTTVTVTATFTCGDKSDTKDYTFTINPLVFSSVSDAIDAYVDGETVYITGVVTSKGSNYAWISDGESEFEIYGTLVEGGVVTSYSDLTLGQVVYAKGTITLYNSTYEFSKTGKIMAVGEATDAQKLAITASELALDDVVYDSTSTLASTGTIFSDVSVGWIVSDGDEVATIGAYDEATVTSETFDDLKSTLYTYDGTDYTALTDSDTYDDTAIYYVYNANELVIVANSDGADVQLTAAMVLGSSFKNEYVTFHVYSDEERLAVAQTKLATLISCLDETLIESTEIDFSGLPEYASIEITVQDSATILSYDSTTKVLTITAPTDETTETFSYVLTCGTKATDSTTVSVTAQLDLEKAAKKYVFYDSTKLSSTSGNAATTAIITAYNTTGIITDVSDVSNVYNGKSGGLCFGTGSKTGSLTLTLSKKVVGVQIYGTYWDSGSTFKVNSTAASDGELASKASTDTVAYALTPLTYSFDATTTITIETTAKRATIYKIVFITE
jgi:hypothetical protein